MENEEEKVVEELSKVNKNKKNDRKIEKYRDELNKLIQENHKLEKDIKIAKTKVDSMKGIQFKINIKL